MLAVADDPGWLLQVLRIVLLDLLLAGDNALVIALAVRGLPPREQRLGRWWGTLGAVLLRVAFLALATWLLALPLLRAVGGALLLWIAWKLLQPQPHGPVDGPAADARPAAAAATEPPPGRTLAQAIRLIVVADVSMSIDNVLAVTGAADGHLGLAIAGIALSIPLVVWGSALLSRVLQHHAWIVWLGGGVLGHVAGVLLVEDPWVARWLGPTASPGWHPLPLALALLLTAYGGWSSLRRR